jgi:hypothetical protein
MAANAALHQDQAASHQRLRLPRSQRPSAGVPNTPLALRCGLLSADWKRGSHVAEHPDVWFPIGTNAIVDQERCEPRGKNAFAVLRKCHISPAFPLPSEQASNAHSTVICNGA